MFRQVIRKYLPRVTRYRKLSQQQWKAINAILLCRTPALGGELHGCEGCDHQEKRYHSCRNRHCPVCQGDAARKWIEKQKEKLLPVSYFHVVFSLPEELNPLFKYNRALLYDLFFRTGAETLQSFFEDKRHVGGQGGFLGVLHTWGQLIQFHPHIHWVVPNGAIDSNGRWVKPKRADADKFLFPVRAVSKVFRGKFLAALEKLHRKGRLRFPDPQSEASFRDTLNMAAAKKWNVYAKRPFAGPMQVIRYLGRYTHRIAMSPKRILSIGREGVTFRYKDYRQDGLRRTTTMDGELFVRRFIEHVLPEGFRKVRHYGWFRGEVIKRRRAALMEWFKRQSEYVRALGALLASLTEEAASASDCLCPKCESESIRFLCKLPPERIEPTPAYG